LAAGVIGCSSGSPATVRGKVSYAAKPIKSGEVVIYGGDGIPKVGKITLEGTYEVKDVISGEGKIAVRSDNPKDIPNTNRGAKKDPVDPQALKNWFKVPRMYGDPATSGLTVTIKPGENTHDISMIERFDDK
jgi:hypothetical protein